MTRLGPRAELLILALLTIGLLLPFLGKPLHIDDPIYVWIAQQLVEHLLDPCGFDVNWTGNAVPFHWFIDNPPLAAYYLSLVGRLAGWSEPALHASMLPLAVACVGSTWALARSFGASGLLAATPLLLGARGWLRLAALALGLAAAMGLAPALFEDGLPSGTPLAPALAIQLALWSTVGAGILWLAAGDVRETRSPESVLLLLWVLGVFVFATLINWSVGVRFLLPLLPAVAILAARRIQRRGSGAAQGVAPLGLRPQAWLAAGLAASALLSLAVARADTRLARADQKAAQDLVTAYRGSHREVWFQGHWGFQYYAQRLGARPLESGHPLPAGAAVLQPINNSYLWRVDAPLVEQRMVGGPVRLATMNGRIGAGFYSSTWGPLPFALGASPPETYLVYETAP